MAGQLDWPGLQQVCRIERTVSDTVKETHELAYAISSLTREQADATKLLEFNRRHWQIESQHWVRDVTLGEDACREKRGHAGHNLAALRNLCLNLLQLRGTKNIAATLRKFSWRASDLFKFIGILKN